MLLGAGILMNEMQVYVEELRKNMRRAENLIAYAKGLLGSVGELGLKVDEECRIRESIRFYEENLSELKVELERIQVEL